MTTPLIEAIARAIDPLAFRSREKFIAYCLKDGDDQITAERYAQMTYGGNIEQAMFNAQAALTAITEAGMVIVPREPTKAMDDAAHDFLASGDGDAVTGCYTAMISAAQGDG